MLFRPPSKAIFHTHQRFPGVRIFHARSLDFTPIRCVYSPYINFILVTILPGLLDCPSVMSV